MRFRATACLVHPSRLLGTLLVSALLACQPQARPPNLIVILIDTLRPDHLGAYGYARATSPHIDRLAASGTVFTRALAPSSWTRPAVGSLFTSRHPSEHGAVSFRGHLAVALPTLAASLRAAGYDTVGVSGNFVHVNDTSGMSRGFEHWRNPSKHAASKADSIFDTRDRRGRPVHRRAPDAREINVAVLEGLDAAAVARGPANAAPLFLYVHYMEPHAPYSPPAEIRARFVTDPSYRADRNASSDALTALASGRRRASDAERQWLIDLYDAEIATVDTAIAELRGALAERAYGENTVTVVLSDHGESLGERGRYFHGVTLHGETLRVPLIFADSRAGGRGVRRDEPVDLLDVAPTLLAMAGMPPAPGMRGRDLFAANGHALPRRDLIAELHPDPPFEDHVAPRLQRLSLQRWPWKAIAMRGGGPLQVYRIDRDPGEQSALPSSRIGAGLAAEVDRLVDALDRLAPVEAHTGPLDERTREGLRALGYAE